MQCSAAEIETQQATKHPVSHYLSQQGRGRKKIHIYKEVQRKMDNVHENLYCDFKFKEMMINIVNQPQGENCLKKVK